MNKLYRFRKNGNRFIQVQFRHLPGKWMSTGTNDRDEAVRFAERFLSNTGCTPAKSMTFREFATGFFSPEDPRGYRHWNLKHGKKYQDDHYVQQQAFLDNYLIPKFGDYLIDSITDVMIDDFIVDLVGVNGHELADNTKNKVLTAMRVILYEAKRMKLVSTNVASDVMQITETHNARKPFTGTELRLMFPNDDKKLLDIWRTPMWACYFLVMRDTGFRPGEVAGLMRSNYIPALHGVYTKQSVHGSTRTLQKRIKTTDSGFKYKTGVLTSQTERLLQEYMSTLEGDFLFLRLGKLLRTEVSNKHLKASITRAGVSLDGRTQYSLRHSFETDLTGHVEDKVLLELMAHTQYHTEYDHRTPEMILRELQPVRQLLEQRNTSSERPLEAK